MSEVETHDRGLNVLSIDGGGIRGLSSLLMLKECMMRLRPQLGLENMPEVHEHFDFIGGSGTGGISATMLGRLKIPLDQAIELFADLAKDVFSDKKYFSASGSGVFKSTKMQQALKQIVREATGDENSRMMDQHTGGQKCKTVVFAMSKQNLNAGLPVAFRSYQASVNQMSDCTIWEALCATTAHPDLFKSIDIGTDHVKESFVDGGLGCNNPLAHILAEVKLLYPDRHIACVISIGAGHARTIHIPEFSPFQRLFPTNVLTAMKDIAMDSERVAQEMSKRFSTSSNVYFRFNVDQGMQNIDIAEWEQLDNVTAHTRGYTRRHEVSDAINRSVVTIKDRQAVIAVEHIDGSIFVVRRNEKVDTGINVCPQPTTLFVGREGPVQLAVNCLLGNSMGRKVFVIRGLGGAGKTQLALRIVERTREHWADVVYVDATSVETIEATLKAFAELKSIGDTHQATLQWLASTQARWLLVLDNADDPRVNIQKYIPSSSCGSILITTRDRDLLRLAQGPESECNISSMEPGEALQLLLKVSHLKDGSITQGDLDGARALLEDLGHLPLAIVQVGGYILKNQCSFAQYHDIYRKQPGKLLRKHSNMRVQLDGDERTILDTWILSYELLSIIARRLLRAMAFMQRDRITLEIFRRATLNIKRFKPIDPLSPSGQDAYTYVQELLGSFIDSDGDWDFDAFLSRIGEILAYSLIEYDRVNEVYVLHPLVQSWARMMAPDPQANAHTTLILAAALNWYANPEDYIFCRSLHLHVMGVLHACPSLSSDLTACFAEVLSQNGRWREALPLQDDVRRKRGEILGDEHPETLAAMLDLSTTYWYQGHYKQAEQLQVQVLDVRKRALGEDHPDTLNARHSLANTYYDQGRHKQAEELRVQVLDASKRVLGEEHPHTLDAMICLAITYSNQGHYKQAEELQVQVLDARKRVLGEEHPDTLTAMNNLANTYSKQGRHKQAEELRVLVLDARKRVLGEEHPDTLSAMNNLANTCSNQERHKQAEELRVQVLDASKRVLGEEHPDTLRAMGNLAWTYYKQGRHKQAKELEVQVVDGRKRVLGEEHPDTLVAMQNLAHSNVMLGPRYWPAAYRALKK